MKKYTRFITTFSLAGALSAPLLAFAQSGINIGAIKEPYADRIITIINTVLLPVLIAIAFITFLWGIYKYFIAGATNESEKGEGRKFAMWGIIGFVVIFCVWGLVKIVISTLGLQTGGNNNIPPPTFNTGGASAGNTSSLDYQCYDACMAQGGDSNYCTSQCS